MKLFGFLKRKIAAVFLASFLFSCLFGTPMITEATDEETAPKVWSIETETVNGLGFMGGNDGISDENALITRGEFTLYVAELGGFKSGGNSGERYFYDVSANSKYAAAVEFCRQMGYIDGNGGFYFEPEENLTVGQCVKMVVSLLGYKQVAEYGGGYPTGFYSVASKLKLLSGIKKGADEYITAGETARIIYNSFDAEILKQTVYGADGAFSTNGETVLSYNDIYKITAIPTANEFTSVYPRGNTSRKGAVLLGESEYYIGKSEASDMLGIKCDIYLKKTDNDRDEIIYIREKESVKHISINARSISFADNREIEYYVGKSKKSVKVSDDAIVIHNGRSVDRSEAKFSPESGHIDLYDNGDGYKTVIVTEYEYCFIASFNNESEIINFSYGTVCGSASLDLSDMNGYKITSNGKTGKPKDLAEGKLARVSVAKDFKFCCIDVLSKTVSGIVERVNDGDDAFCFVGETKYTIEKNALNRRDIETGKQKKFIVDENNSIVGVQPTVGISAKYAVPVASKYKSLGGSQIKMFTSDEKMIIFTVGDAVKYDGGKISEEELCKKLNGSNPRIIEYKANAKNELLEVKEAVAATGDPDYDTENLTLYTSVGSSESIRALQTRVGKTGVIGTKTFAVPAKDYAYYGDDKYSFKESYFGYGQYYSDYKLYCVGASGCAKLAIAVFGSDGSRTFSAEESPSMFVVSGTGATLAKDGTKSFAVFGLYDGKEEVYGFRDDVYEIEGNKNYKDVKAGDVMAIKIDDNGVVDRYFVGYEHGTSLKKLLVTSGNGIDECRRYQLFYGKCMYNKDNILTIYCEDSGQYYPLANANAKGMPVYIYEKSGSSETVKVGEWADVRAEDAKRGVNGDMVVVHANGFVAKEILIIRD